MMDAAKVDEIMAKVPAPKLRRAVGGAFDGGVFVLRGEGVRPGTLDEPAFHASIPGSDGSLHFGADRMDPLTPAEASAFLARMRSVLEAP